jgi:hypothetical protein
MASKEQKEACHRMKITVKSLGDLIGIEFQLPDGQGATLELPQEDAQHVGLALIGHASSEDTNSKSLFEESPALSTWNPSLELSISDKGQLLMLTERGIFALSLSS